LTQLSVEKFGARTDIIDQDGKTALDWARELEHYTCVEYFEMIEWFAGFNCFDPPALVSNPPGNFGIRPLSRLYTYRPRADG
jgi:hypothetical protein